MNPLAATIISEVVTQGVQLIKDELSMQAATVVEVRDELSIRNEDLLSDRLLVDKNIHKSIKEKVANHSENIRKIIAATAYYVQEEKFKTIDEALLKLKGLSKIEQNRLSAFADSQKKINLSYGTLSAVIEIFKGVNQSLLNEIQTKEHAQSQLDKTKVYLKSSIIAYELINFVISQLSNFGVDGVNDLKLIRDEVFEDIEKGRRDDEALMASVSKMSNQQLGSSVRSEINDRNAFRNSVKVKWDEMFEKIKDQQRNVDSMTGFIGDLKIIRDNVRNRINIMNITATTLAVASSIDTVGSFASSLQAFELPALDEKLTRELLNLGG